MTISLIPIQRSAEFYTRSVTQLITRNREFSLAIGLQIIFCLSSFGFAVRGSKGFLLPAQFVVLAASLDSMRWHWRLTLRLIDASAAAALLRERVQRLISAGSYDEANLVQLRLETAELAERSVRRNETDSARDMIDILKRITSAWLLRFGSKISDAEERSFLTAVGEDFERIATISIEMHASYTLDAVLSALVQLRAELMRSSKYLLRTAVSKVIGPCSARILAAAARQHMTRPVIDAMPGLLAEPDKAERPADVQQWELEDDFRNAAEVVIETCRVMLRVEDIGASNEVLDELMSTLDTRGSPERETYEERLDTVLRLLDETAPLAVSVKHVVPVESLLDAQARQLPLAAAYDIASSASLWRLLHATGDYEQHGPYFMLVAKRIGSHLSSMHRIEGLLGTGTFFLMREMSRDVAQSLLQSAILLANSQDERWRETYQAASVRAIDLWGPFFLREDEIKPDDAILRQARDVLDMITSLAISDLRRAFGGIADSASSEIVALLDFIIRNSNSSWLTDQALARVLALKRCAEASEKGRPRTRHRQSVVQACEEAIGKAIPDEKARTAALSRVEMILSNAPERTYIREPVDALVEYRRFMEEPSTVSAPPASEASAPPASNASPSTNQGVASASQPDAITPTAPKT